MKHEPAQPGTTAEWAVEQNRKRRLTDAEWLTEQRHITLSNPGQNQVAYRAHAEIYQAIASRDPDKSEEVMRAHLDQVSDMYWRSVGGSS